MNTTEHPIHTIDLHFQGVDQAIAAYVIPHEGGAVLVECGPASTFPALQAGLEALGLQVKDITDLLVTHIHLDHAGAIGWLAREGVRVHVHHVGAPHLIDPSKLLSSAERIYGELMKPLWGEFLPVPADLVNPLYDGDKVVAGGVQLLVVDTPGHANHHHAYVMGDLCFSGDVGGIRLPQRRHLELPLPPPELNLEAWMASVERLRGFSLRAIAPTHFGVYPDADSHLKRAYLALQEVSEWLDEATRDQPEAEVFNRRYYAWLRERAQARGDDPDRMGDVETVNPAYMSAMGLYRYWRKFRLGR